MSLVAVFTELETYSAMRFEQGFQAFLRHLAELETYSAMRFEQGFQAFLRHLAELAMLDEPLDSECQRRV